MGENSPDQPESPPPNPTPSPPESPRPPWGPPSDTPWSHDTPRPESSADAPPTPPIPPLEPPAWTPPPPPRPEASPPPRPESRPTYAPPAGSAYNTPFGVPPPGAPPRPAAAYPPPYGPPPPPPPRRLMRSSRERMWAGVAGGMAEYLDLDPSLVRLLWVAATVITGGLAVAVYILAWIILPRDDRAANVGSPTAWRDWSEEFHNETQRLAAEARRMADDVRDASQGWRAPGPGEPGPAAASSKGYQTPTTGAPQTAEDPWWRSERYMDRPPRGHHYPAKSTGVVLVVLGVLLLAANAGVFRWIDGRTMWPLILIGLGVILLGRQSGWWSR